LQYQWRKGGVAIGGATDTILAIASAQPGDNGCYTVVVKNSAGETLSNAAVLMVIPADTGASHAVLGGGYVAGGTVTITNTVRFTGTAASVEWQVPLPAGWSLAADTASTASSRPAIGTANLLEWTWTAVAVGPVTFTYTLSVPAGTAGTPALAAVVRLQQGGPAALLLLAKPDPLSLAPMVAHSADTDKNWQIGLIELTRVIELYNTRFGTERTGRYAVATTITEDGFASDPVTPDATAVTLARYHAADSNRDGQLNLVELTRVIQLYNYRVGTIRTGDYHAQAGTEDGFAPGP
jgi:uncharacterized repeat protein (TIGR01451 family)